MNPLLIGPLLEIGTSIINKIFPDPNQAADAKLKLLQMQQDGDLKELSAALERDLAQAKVNEVEAASSNMFVAGWRPAIGWVCAAALAYQYLIRPLMPLFVPGMEALPSIDDSLWELVFVMLGFGGLRSFEKHRGLAK